MMTDEQLDVHLDNILKASGSALKHYSMQKTKDDMRQALRQAIAELESQEPVAWTSDDMAYRPNGLPQDFVKHEVESVYDWSDWVCPNPEQYFMKCCDCGLVHEMQFKVAKYKLGNECEFVEDTNLQAVFKARRTHPPQRKPLTIEEIESLWDHEMYVHCSGITALRAITRAIEAAHGIKE